MNNISSRTTIDYADTAAEAVRALIHLTHGQRALSEPAELDRLVAELAVMAGRLPQLLRQLRGWLHVEQHAGRLCSDDTTHPARIVDRATDRLAEAGHAADDLGSALDDAHQLLAHLAATETERSHKPGQSDASAGIASRDGRAETVATSGHFAGRQRAGLMAASGQKPMSLDTGRPIVVAMPGRNCQYTDMDMQLPEGLLKSDGDPPKDRLAATAAQGISTALVSNECRHGAAALGRDR